MVRDVGVLGELLWGVGLVRGVGVVRGVYLDRGLVKLRVLAVQQGCMLSSKIFLTVIDWIIKRTTADQNVGIQWTLILFYLFQFVQNMLGSCQ